MPNAADDALQPGGVPARAVDRRPLFHLWEWQWRARCRGVDPEMFFTADHERGERRAAREAAAKKICRSCAVRDICLDHALTTHESHGIWGGTTPRERQRVAAVDTNRSA